MAKKLHLIDYDAHPDWCRATIIVGGEETTFSSVYSQTPGSASVGEWATPLTALMEQPARERVVLMGDFNLWHSSWMELHGRRAHRGAEVLINLAALWGLDLITAPDSCTRCAPGH